MPEPVERPAGLFLKQSPYPNQWMPVFERSPAAACGATESSSSIRPPYVPRLLPILHCPRSAVYRHWHSTLPSGDKPQRSPLLPAPKPDTVPAKGQDVGRFLAPSYAHHPPPTFSDTVPQKISGTGPSQSAHIPRSWK